LASMDEIALIEKLIKIEAFFAGTTTEGERISADRARQRILLRLQEMLPNDPPVEYKFTFPDMWSRKVFVSLLRRYDLKPYRYHSQRYTTVMVQVPKTFVGETLWPEFQKINAELKTYLQEVTDRVIKQALHEDSSDAVVVDQPLQIDMHMDRDSNSRDPIKAKEEQSGCPSDIPRTSHTKKRKNKKRKKKRRKQ